MFLTLGASNPAEMEHGTLLTRIAQGSFCRNAPWRVGLLLLIRP